MKWISVFLCSILCAGSVSGQGRASLMYFSLPVTAEQEIIPSEAYVSVSFTPIQDITLKTYKDNDFGIATLARLMANILNDDRNGYNGMSVTSDSALDNSYEFYRLFLPHSKEPVLRGRTEIADYSIYHVALEPNLPCALFCFKKSGTKFLNSPQLLDHPVIIAMSEAVNKHLMMPDEFQPLKAAPLTHAVIKFDSSLGMSTNLAFYFNIKSIRYNVNNATDTANRYDSKYSALLGFYGQASKDLKAGNMEQYYSRLSSESKTRIAESIKESANPAKARDFFREYMSSYILGWQIVDMGQLKMLMVANGNEISYRSTNKVYIREGKTRTEIININKEFYFDDLLRTNEMKQALFKAITEKN